MDYFIEIRDGRPIGHPILGSNFRDAFPEIDVHNLPPHYARFVRVPMPQPALYQKLVSLTPSYELEGGVWTDVWTIRDMTDAEKLAAQQEVRDRFNAWEFSDNFTAWTLDEATNRMVPPTPRPRNGNYAWKGGETNDWVLRDFPPDDGKYYSWNPTTWSWVDTGRLLSEFNELIRISSDT